MNHFYLLRAFVTGAGVAVQSVINAHLRLVLGGVALLPLGVSLIRWKTS